MALPPSLLYPIWRPLSPPSASPSACGVWRTQNRPAPSSTAVYRRQLPRAPAVPTAQMLQKVGFRRTFSPQTTNAVATALKPRPRVSHIEPQTTPQPAAACSSSPAASIALRPLLAKRPNRLFLDMSAFFSRRPHGTPRVRSSGPVRLTTRPDKHSTSVAPSDVDWVPPCAALGGLPRGGMCAHHGPSKFTSYCRISTTFIPLIDSITSRPPYFIPPTPLCRAAPEVDHVAPRPVVKTCRAHLTRPFSELTARSNKSGSALRPPYPSGQLPTLFAPTSS